MNYSVEVPGRFYDCGEESVVYFDLQTGDTHLVSTFAAHVIRLLTSQPMDSDTLMERLAEDIAGEDLPYLAEVLPNILEELTSLDVVERR
jgi:PqqD family protein of HPr-rel-A system